MAINQQYVKSQPEQPEPEDVEEARGWRSILKKILFKIEKGFKVFLKILFGLLRIVIRFLIKLSQVIKKRVPLAIVFLVIGIFIGGLIFWMIWGRGGSPEGEIEEEVYQNPSPEHVTDRFYESWIGHGGDPIEDKIYESSEAVTKGFIKRINKIAKTFDGQDDYDPVLCAKIKPQDVNVPRAEVDDKEARIEIIEEWADGNETRITVVLKKSRGKWKMDEVICDEIKEELLLEEEER